MTYPVNTQNIRRGPPAIKIISLACNVSLIAYACSNWRIIYVNPDRKSLINKTTPPMHPYVHLERPSHRGTIQTLFYFPFYRYYLLRARDDHHSE